MQDFMKKLTDNKAEKFALQFGDVFKTLPHLPKTWVDLLVKIAPPLALVGAVLSILAGPLFGLLSVISLITLNPFLVFTVFAAAVISFVSAVLLFWAYPLLKKKSLTGWMLLFWVDILGLVQIVMNIFFHHNDVVGSIIGSLIGFYILFEMRPRYTK